MMVLLGQVVLLDMLVSLDVHCGSAGQIGKYSPLNFSRLARRKLYTLKLPTELDTRCA